MSRDEQIYLHARIRVVQAALAESRVVAAEADVELLERLQAARPCRDTSLLHRLVNARRELREAYLERDSFADIGPLQFLRRAA